MRIIFLIILLLLQFNLLAVNEQEVRQTIDDGLNQNKVKYQILYLSQAIEQSKGHDELSYLSYFNRAVIHYKNEQLSEAYNDFKMALTFDVNDIDCLNNLGLIAQRLQKYGEAENYFEQIIGLMPKNTMGYFLRGNLNMVQKFYNRAILDYNRVLEFNPFHTQSLNNRGWAYFYRKNYSKSLTDFEKVLSIDPSDEYALEGQRKVYELLDQKTLMSQK